MTARRVLVPAFAGGGALLAVVAFLALGVWQLQRREWKHALIAGVEARAHAAPAALPARAEWPLVTAARDAYRRVEAEGRFRHDREVLVRATTALGSGYWVMTPLETAGGTVLVNRGFVPPERRDPASRPASTDPVRVTGLLRITEPGGGFLRSNDPAAGNWYSRDVAAIAAARDLADAAPFFIDVEGIPGTYPAGGLTVLRFHDNHLVYALTWFSLAFMAGAGGIIVLRHRRGGERMAA
ncbi:SURF1 family protein [Roseococcus sp. YIM B11640]|uniref:SURF1 family protein n=1 Tax=Roseococcus sp. YIM B11640 TaxID=3133973 RepID=UPI003C7A4A41